MSYMEVEKVKQNGFWEMPMSHKHSYYELYFLIKGERKYYIDNELYKISDGSIALISPGALHKTEGGSFERIIINFDIQYMDCIAKKTIDKLFNLKAVKLSENYKEKFEAVIERINNEYSVNRDKSSEYLKIKIADLILELDKYCENKNTVISGQPFSNKLLLGIINFIDDNIACCTPKIIADRFYISNEYLSRFFKKNMGITLIEYITNKKLNKASKLLINTGYPIEKIACECGYSSGNYFSLAFKNKIGMSPLNYKKNKSNPKSDK